MSLLQEQEVLLQPQVLVKQKLLLLLMPVMAALKMKMVTRFLKLPLTLQTATLAQAIM